MFLERNINLHLLNNGSFIHNGWNEYCILFQSNDFRFSAQINDWFWNMVMYSPKKSDEAPKPAAAAKWPKCSAGWWWSIVVSRLERFMVVAGLCGLLGLLLLVDLGAAAKILSIVNRDVGAPENEVAEDDDDWPTRLSNFSSLSFTTHEWSAIILSVNGGGDGLDEECVSNAKVGMVDSFLRKLQFWLLNNIVLSIMDKFEIWCCCGAPFLCNKKFCNFSSECCFSANPTVQTDELSLKSIRYLDVRYIFLF